MTDSSEKKISITQDTSEEDLFGLTSKSNAGEVGKKNPMDSPPGTPTKPAWCKSNRESTNSDGSPRAQVQGDSKRSSTQSASPVSAVHFDPNTTTGEAETTLASAGGESGGDPSLPGIKKFPSFTLKSPEESGIQDIEVEEGPLSVTGPVKRTASMFEVECGSMSAPAPITMRGSTEDGFDDCSNLVQMTAENWSLAKRFGFPCSANGQIVEEEHNSYHLMQANDRLAEEHWDQALRSGANLLAAANEQTVTQLQRLSRKFGIPQHLRGIIWLTLSGVALKMEENGGFCATVMRRWGETTGDAALTIEKDLDRTFPEHPYFAAAQPGIKRLKNVLHALCWRNPLLTYCQSFNFLAGTLLLFLDDEEAVFWMMLHLLENLLPNDYYGEGLIGLKIDQEVAAHLLGQHCPKLSDHFEEVRFDVRALVPAWLMSLYIGTFPPETTVRVWDYMLTHDPKKFTTVPLAILISFLKMHQDEFLRINDAGELHVAMGIRAQKSFDGNKVVKAAHDLKIMSTDLQNLRRIARQNILVDLQVQKKKREMFHKLQAQRAAEMAERAANGIIDNEDAPRNLSLRSPASGYASGESSVAQSPNTKGPAITHPQYWEEADLTSIEMDSMRMDSGPLPGALFPQGTDAASPPAQHRTGAPPPTSLVASPPPQLHE